MTVGIYLFQAGAGRLGAIVVGFATAGFTIVVGQYAFSFASALPAARASYDMTLALFTPRDCRGMVAAVFRHPWRHSCRGYLLGPCVHTDRHRSQTGRCTRAHSSHRMELRPAGDYARLMCPGWHDADIWSSLLIITSRPLAHFDLIRIISWPTATLRSPAHAPTFVCSATTEPPFRTPGFFFLRRECGASCMNRPLAGTSPKCRSADARTWPLIGLIWPKAGCASIA
jgi:hypothetical protein